jgi:hypothetical protein
LITGRVVIAGSVRHFTGGVLRVRLEDVSYVDTAAKMVAEAVIHGVSHPSENAPAGSNTVVPFSLEAIVEIIANHDYAVRASLEADDAGHEHRFTIRSDQAYRVLTRGYGSDVTVALGK